MAKRKIINIDEEKCNGCGLCIPNCPEGALQVIDKKVRLVSDLFCDGLGACIGHCPQGAITVEEREAQPYDERSVMANIVKQGPSVIKAHLQHLNEHNEKEYLHQALGFLQEQGITVPSYEKKHAPAVCGCPGARELDMRQQQKKAAAPVETRESELRQWPVQIVLVSPHARYFDNVDLLVAADCVPFAYPQFHEDLLAGKTLLVGCPKLDDTKIYQEKLGQILAENSIKSVTYAHMEVPCCSGLIGILRSAIAASGKDIPFHDVTISIQGKKLP